MRRHGLSLLVLGVAGLCSQPNSGPPAPTSPLAVEWAGCQSVFSGPVCHVDGTQALRLWVPAPDEATLSVLADGVRLQVTGTPLQGGQAFDVMPQPTWRRLEVHEADGGRWSLELAKETVHPALARAREFKSEGKLKEAREELQGASFSPIDAARAKSIAARLSIASGELDSAVVQLEESQALHLQLGAIGEAAYDALARAWVLVEQHQLERAEHALQSIDANLKDLPEEGSQAAYYRALAAQAEGDRRRTLSLLTQAEASAQRLGLTKQLLAVDSVSALVLAELGQFSRARESLERQLPSADLQLCEKAKSRLNLAWVNLLANEAGRATGEIEGLLGEALGLYQGGCPSPTKVANVYTNRALLELRRGAPHRAAFFLEKARNAGAPATVWLMLWWYDLDGRVALSNGEPALALDHFRRLATLAKSVASGDGLWRALVGESEAQLALKKHSLAISALSEAESVLDREGLHTPLTVGLATALDAREKSARLLVSTLLDLGRPGDAMAVARRARARSLRWTRIEERLAALKGAERAAWQRAITAYHLARTELEEAAKHDWMTSALQLTQVNAIRANRASELREALEAAIAALGEPPPEQLPSLADGQVALLAFPTAERWVAFAAGPKETSAAQFDLVVGMDAEAWATAVLSPFDSTIASADEVVVFPYGPLRTVDVHALPWRGAPLISHVPVRYALDVGRSLLPDRASAAPKTAMTVIDPLGDLPFARAEAPQLGTNIGARVLNGQQASVAAVKEALTSVDLFHFAGHGEAGVMSEWDAALRLADGTLRSADVLVLPRVPKVVVLSGCTTAGMAPTGGEPLGLAQAFVAAGSEVVVATSRAINDAEAQTFITGLLKHGPLTPEGVVKAFRLQAMQQNSGSAWQAFRTLTP